MQYYENYKHSEIYQNYIFVITRNYRRKMIAVSLLIVKVQEVVIIIKHLVGTVWRMLKNLLEGSAVDFC